MNRPGFHRSNSSSTCKLEEPVILRRQSSVKSLVSLAGIRRKKRKDSDSVSCTDSCTTAESGRDVLQEMVSFKKRLSRRMSSILDFSKPSSDGRRHLDSVPHVNNVKFTISAEVDDDGLENNISIPRRIQRKDIPICWLDESQVVQTRRLNKKARTDIFSNLVDTLYNRHLARYILTFLREEDFVNMSQMKTTSETGVNVKTTFCLGL
ncbi:uncharacterized protein LOC111702279 isoform X2 [Eurytemora carolleeae]|uniref:uncharacterized protein LOC111702279 isoform X2 n=1 Tax=Eurytemora carolleeae TaxID=1294199 RepID=UPI000C780F09|nr:uncharacterized protein LOC111702279 isoform X2 [Eurytemora carolleeae]|eukprot:XP_023329688.1 uncharacterized protein LOC111702279 isoform X2 [Eurytemora affinis]